MTSLSQKKADRLAFRGELYDAEGALIGGIFKAEGGYQVRKAMEFGGYSRTALLQDGRVFKGSDFVKGRTLDLGYATVTYYTLR